MAHGFLNYEERSRNTALKLPTFIESGPFGYGFISSLLGLASYFLSECAEGLLPLPPNASAQKLHIRSPHDISVDYRCG